MKKSFSIFKCFLPVIILISCNGTKENGVCPAAQEIQLKHFDNLFKVSDEVYRADQPNSKGMAELENLGIKTILNLRNYHTDDEEAKKTNLILERVPLEADEISYADVVTSLKKLESCKKPVLVHCWHGSDRTGCIIAAYRMTKCGWTKEEAIKEFQLPKFGFHEGWFPNILTLLNSIDVEKLKKDIQ